MASAGIEPSSISFPFRKIFGKNSHVHYRMAEARLIFPEKNILQTSIGKIEYDYLVLAAGTTSNFFGNQNIEREAIPMKTLQEAMGLRNALRAALVALGLAQSPADLEDCVTAVEGITNNGAVAGTISNAATPYTVPAGYHSGAGKVTLTNSIETALAAI